MTLFNASDICFYHKSGMVSYRFDSSCNDIIPDDVEVIYCYGKSRLPNLPSGLKIIYCANNQLQELPALPSGLESLYCDNNQLQKLPNLPLGLKILSCYNNQLQKLPNLPLDLESLYCDNNQLQEIPPLPSGLIFFSCTLNQVPVIYNESILEIIAWQEGEHKKKVEAFIVKYNVKIIQRAWTRYWYHPNKEGVAPYAKYMAYHDLI